MLGDIGIIILMEDNMENKDSSEMLEDFILDLKKSKQWRLVCRLQEIQYKKLREDFDDYIRTS